MRGHTRPSPLCHLQDLSQVPLSLAWSHLTLRQEDAPSTPSMQARSTISLISYLNLPGDNHISPTLSNPTRHVSPSRAPRLTLPSTARLPRSKTHSRLS
ncbi:hypothetical protein BC830DRAFT_1107745 [Chytriomyces sp. MP71]|nr:hypothetical protein BC830DRAFT_1107745 [Chytriomyces sp. MP71]